MPVQKVKGGYRFGASGKVYKQQSLAERQGRAIKASMAKSRHYKKGTKSA